MDIAMPFTFFSKRTAPPESSQSSEETALEVALYTPPRSKEHQGEDAVMVTMQDVDDSSMAVVQTNIDRGSGRSTASNPVPKKSIQEQSREAQLENQAILDENQIQKKHIRKFQKELDRLSAEYQHLHGAYNSLLGSHAKLQGKYDELQDAYANLELHHKEQRRKFKKMARDYEDLDKKYMDLARTLQVTEDDRSTINKKLSAVASSIENLVIRGRGNGSVNLNRGAAIQYFSNLRLLEYFPLQEHQLEPFHYSLLMEAAMMLILCHHLFLRPLQCIFEGSEQFEAICGWMESRGSTVTARWRQELCLFLAQDDGEMKLRKEKEVDVAIMELEELVSSVYGKVDTHMSDKIEELCNIAFDLSYAMFGMESKVYPTQVKLGSPFNEEEMTLARRSDPSGSVSCMVFPRFQDSNNKLYFKAKVWCPLEEPKPELDQNEK
ncbi:hypothetical protein K457DRAFT_898134 [Linnemannia elongata AG-77]|uniref:Uncharacterized protein n=1 Tax=Linnemannia elongata AG-77 TaxID=1314771 RepID=A0A197KF59_9FUNG|nr:hypothetical protein K457DRAFT_898134 [Linnemannia elongata AG-77]